MLKLSRLMPHVTNAMMTLEEKVCKLTKFEILKDIILYKSNSYCTYRPTSHHLGLFKYFLKDVTDKYAIDKYGHINSVVIHILYCRY